MMGWMNDILEYFERDPIYRKFHHGDISRSLTYVFTENFLLPLSHDEVVHGKGAMISKMPGDEWQRFANLRLLYLCQYTHPGQKLLFMGCEIGQTSEWNVNESIPWHLLEFAPHKGLQDFVRSLNQTYTQESALYDINYKPEGYEWIDHQDHENTVLSFIRKSENGYVVVVLNFSPVVRNDYQVGVPELTNYQEILNSDDKAYWGSGVQNEGLIKATKANAHGRPYAINITIPPLAGIILKPTKN